MQDILRDADGEIGDLNAKLQEMTDAAESHAQKVRHPSSVLTRVAPTVDERGCRGG